MFCEKVGICGGCTMADSKEVEAESKIYFIASLFGLDSRDLEFFDSPSVGYRTRAEFRLFKQDSLNGNQNQSKPTLYLAMSAFNQNKRIKISSCPILLPHLQAMLKELLAHINENPILQDKLYAIEVLGTNNNSDTGASNAIFTLIYHKPLNSAWENLALNLSHKLNAHIIGRSKNKKHILTQDFILDEINILGRIYGYFRQESRFSQPNAYTNPQMIVFVKSAIKAHNRKDLLEMYCGDGNFSIALASEFKRVFATEIVKSCITTLQKNIAYNRITNITSARLSGEETIQALQKKRAFFRLKDIDITHFSFSHILIDPPRSGIDNQAMLEFIASFDYIIYISCNPLSLKSDLEILLQTHKIEHFVIFNQFPHTKHIECGVILRHLNPTKHRI